MIASSLMSGLSASLGVTLIGFVIAMPHIPAPNGSTFIETQLCASGRTLRIEIPGQKQPEKEAPMPCHAVCARDDDGSKQDTTPDDEDGDT